MTDIKVSKVAVIGAGISGVASAAHLLREGLDVTVFERGSDAGGVWRYEDAVAVEPEYPATKPSRGDYDLIDDPSLSVEERKRRFAPPGPCYASLRSNVYTPMMKTTLLDWPEGTPEFVNHIVNERYIQTLSRKTGVHEKTKYETRVDELEKVGESWIIRTSTLEAESGRHGLRRETGEGRFDAVVVASGHYNAPRVPDIEGLRELQKRWPERVQHSKTYRRPEGFQGENVLLIGGGVSSLDIANDIAPIAGKIFQSTRGGLFDTPAEWLPAGGKRVVEVSSFEVRDVSPTSSGTLPSADGNSETDDGIRLETLPVLVHLKDGSVLDDLHHIFICTGYDISYPYFRPLKRYHADDLSDHHADGEVLVTAEGVMVHNLYDDIFYIPDPTLAFVGAPYHVATFSCFEVQGIVVAKVFAGLASLPAEPDMRQWYAEKVAQKGLGRFFHSLKEDNAEIEYVRHLVDWLNKEAERRGIKTAVDGHSKQWLEWNERKAQMIILRYGRGGR